MKKISTLLSFVTLVLLCSCTTQPHALTGNTSAYKSSKKRIKPAVSPAATNFMLVANKPAVTQSGNADADWVASSNPHVVAATPRLKRLDAVALSAATTVEGHDILKREIEKAIKTSKAEAKKTRKGKKPKKGKGTPKNSSHIAL
jgi:hypothetical protein